MVMALLLAATTYGVTRQNMVRQREDDATIQAQRNAERIQGSLLSPDTPEEVIQDELDNLPSTADSSPLVFNSGEWLLGRNADPLDLPTNLIEQASTGDIALRMRHQSAGRSLLAIGIPLPLTEQTYFEIVPLGDIEDALRTLGITLIGAGLLTSLAGAGFGVWASSRVLRPIADVSLATSAIAGGNLETRLDRRDDPDLDAIVESFNNMAEALQDRIDREARFTSDVSHELRSPLMTLRASIDVMRGRREELPDRSQAALDLLVHDVDRFENLIEDLLEISRLDAGAADMFLDITQISLLVRNTIDFLDRDTAVLVDADAEELLVEVDKRRMAQVLRNLLDNADNHADGVSNIRITKDGSDMVRVCVGDTGPGIADDQKALVFERFARGTTAGRRGSGRGTGLGLALVAEHVRLHHGKVWVEDRDDNVSGSRFIVQLPVARPQP